MAKMLHYVHLFPYVLEFVGVFVHLELLIYLNRHQLLHTLFSN